MSEKTANQTSDASRTGPTADEERAALAKKAEAHRQDLEKSDRPAGDDDLPATGAFEK